MIEDLRRWFAKKGYFSMFKKRNKIFIVNKIRSIHIDYTYLGDVEITVCERRNKFELLASLTVSGSGEIQHKNYLEYEPVPTLEASK